MEISRQMILRPDVMHCNDWQTGLINGLLQTQYNGRPGFERTASVMTLHNMAYQGRFWHFDMPLTGMDWKHFNHNQMEAWGDLNLLKTGIAFADQITTVSPTSVSYTHLDVYKRQVMPSVCGTNQLRTIARTGLSLTAT